MSGRRSPSWRGQEVCVSGLGAVTALGHDTGATWEALLQGRSAVRHWDDLAAEGHALDVACRVDDAGWAGTVPPRASRGRSLARLAAGEALAQAGLLGSDDRLVDGLDPQRVGVFVGTTMGESGSYEESHETGRFDLTEAGSAVFADVVAEGYGLGGPRRTFGTACAAGNYALGAAARAVASGRLDVAVAGGVEPFSRIAMVGFARMRAMAPAGCTPFGRGRRGMTLGEGAGLMVLQRRADVARPLATILGLGLSGDAHHPTAPREDGTGMSAAMTAALDVAGTGAREVGWVSAHGTGTPLADAAEARALRRVFDDRPPPVSSIKGGLGHTLGAATAIEAVVSVLALREQTLPPNVGGAGPVEVDDDLGLDVVGTARPAAGLDRVLSCGYAFGGLNSALVLGRAS